MKAYVGVEVHGQLYALVAAPLVPIKYDSGCATGLIWAFREEENLLPMLGIKPHSWMSSP